MNKLRTGIAIASILTLSVSGSSVAATPVKTDAPIKTVVKDATPILLKPIKKEVKKQLSAIELKDVLYEAGFRGKDLVEAWGTAMKESMGKPFAHNKNSNTGDNSYGLFQINMIGSLGPARLKQFGLKNNKELFDPATNAKIAFIMSDGGKDWSAWHGITSKTKSFMEEFPN